MKVQYSNIKFYFSNFYMIPLNKNQLINKYNLISNE